MSPGVMTPTRAVHYRRTGLTVAELYFDDTLPDPPPKADIVRFLAVPSPRTDLPWIRRNTLSIDLTLSENELFRALGTNTRYKVRRAMMRDPVNPETFDSPAPELITEFAESYDEFAASKSLRPVFRPRLYALAESGMLLISRIIDESASPLVWHAYAAGARRALLLYSASIFRRYEDSAQRNAIGRANRYLHWHDMLWFKAAGHDSHDMGGINVAGEDPETRRITEFKLAFGGRPQPSHTHTAAISPKGRLAMTILRLRGIEL